MILTVDIVLLTLDDGRLKVALHKRDRAPFEGCLALPGGYIHENEDRDDLDTAYRVLLQKTGFKPSYLEPLRNFSGPDRDPRGWSLSSAFFALIPVESLKSTPGNPFVFYPVDSLPDIAFDHAKQIAVAVDRIRTKSNYSTIPCMLLPEKFTIKQLHETYEQVLGAPQNISNFRRKILGAGLLIKTADTLIENHRPAVLYMVKELGFLNKTLTSD